MSRNAAAISRLAAPTTSLVRADLLRAALGALNEARNLGHQAARRSRGQRAYPSDGRAGDNTARLLERLDAHREILARRAANVAMAPICTAEELSELRDAARILVAVHGGVARHLGLVSHLS